MWDSSSLRSKCNLILYEHMSTCAFRYGSNGNLKACRVNQFHPCPCHGIGMSTRGGLAAVQYSLVTSRYYTYSMLYFMFASSPPTSMPS